jgi:hypothetical protein
MEIKEFVQSAIEQEKWQSATALLDLIQQMEREKRTTVLLEYAKVQ